jgi:DNA-directed RNA polymerase specialized sigma subunit
MISEEDPELTRMVKEDQNQEALVELISRHSGIYIHMVKCFGSKSLTQDQVNDLLDEKDYNIYKAAIDFDESKSKFSTFLANKTKYICLTQKTINKSKSNFTSYDDIDFAQISTSLEPDAECSLNESYERIINMILKHQDERVKTIFYERYFCGERGKLKPWKQIAQKVNLSTQGCINVHNKTLKEFKNKVKNEKIKF